MPSRIRDVAGALVATINASGIAGVNASIARYPYSERESLPSLTVRVLYASAEKDKLSRSGRKSGYGYDIVVLRGVANDAADVDELIDVTESIADAINGTVLIGEPEVAPVSVEIPIVYDAPLLKSSRVFASVIRAVYLDVS